MAAAHPGHPIIDHYAMIGMIAAEWAYFESLIDRYTQRLAGIDDHVGTCLTSQIAGHARKLDAYIALAKHLSKILTVGPHMA